jgi:hypothetical protein
MRVDSESRSRYLSLALTSRRTIDHLRNVATGNPVDADLDSILNKLLASTGREGNANFVSHLQATGAWTFFEELSTVDELKDELGFNDLGEVVVSVLRDASAEVRGQQAKRLISFLTAVEGRALQRYTDSMEMRFA